MIKEGNPLVLLRYCVPRPYRSSNHITNSSETDELVKHLVRMVKWGLRKYGLLCCNHCDWDLMLLSIVMGYQISRQTSLASYSLYQVLYRRQPMLPNYVKKKLNLVVDLDDPKVWAQCL